MKRVVFLSTVYNAEATVRRAIESVLNQTYGEFVYVITDNGSTDHSGAIIREYAAKDSRILTRRNVENNHRSGSNLGNFSLPDVLKREKGYWVSLDADDEYKPDFLEKMMRFAMDNTLDIAFCGTEYALPDGSSQTDIPAQTLVVEDADIVSHLPTYYQYATRMWGALFSLKLLPRMEPPPDRLEKWGSMYDSKGVLHALEYAKRVGTFAENLHKHYISPNQFSRKIYSPHWFWWMNEIYEQTRMFILSYGPMSKENEDFLTVRRLIWLKYILPRIKDANAPLERRTWDLVKIFDDDRVIEHLALDWKKAGILTDKIEFLQEQLEWAEQQNIFAPGQPYIQKLIEILKHRLEGK